MLKNASHEVLPHGRLYSPLPIVLLSPNCVPISQLYSPLPTVFFPISHFRRLPKNNTVLNNTFKFQSVAFSESTEDSCFWLFGWRKTKSRQVWTAQLCLRMRYSQEVILRRTFHLPHFSSVVFSTRAEINKLTNSYMGIQPHLHVRRRWHAATKEYKECPFKILLSEAIFCCG